MKLKIIRNIYKSRSASFLSRFFKLTTKSFYLIWKNSDSFLTSLNNQRQKIAGSILERKKFSTAVFDDDEDDDEGR